MLIAVAVGRTRLRSRLLASTSTGAKEASIASRSDAATQSRDDSLAQSAHSASPARRSPLASHATGDAKIAVAPAAPAVPASRGFLPCRLSDAGPANLVAVIQGLASETFRKFCLLDCGRALWGQMMVSRVEVNR